ncbi:MAG: SulP family inorganic anion transporter [Actinomycetota bacterium]
MIRPPTTGDVVAGLTVALVAIPQSLAYAELAGLPARHGLYASALPAVLAALFVSSRHLQTGPVALTALLTFGALSATAEPFTEAYIANAALLALLVGAARVALGLARWGRVAYLLSEPVMVGFTTGAAILITASQLPRVLDADVDGRGVVDGALWAVVHPSEWSPAAVAFALGTAALIIVGRRLHPLFPGVLVALVMALAASRLTGYDGSTVGELEGGFLAFRWSFPWGDAASLILPALAIALVGFAEPASIARTFAAEDRQPWSADREFISQGMANLAAGVSGAFPVGGSFSRSSLSRAAGATSPWAGAITGLAVLVAIPATPLLAPLPSAVLGAVVMVAVSSLIRLETMLYLLRHSRLQAAVASGTLLATLLAAPRLEIGVAIGIGLAILAHLYRELSVTASVELIGDRLVIRPHGVLWFATVPAIDERLRAHLAAHPQVTATEVDMSAVGRLDYRGASALARMAEESAANGVPVRFTNVPPGCARAAAVHLSSSM